MTEADYNAQIAENQNAIWAYQQEISQLEEQIQELNAMKNQTADLQAVLHSTASRAEARIGGMTSLWGTIASVLNGNFFSNILTVVKGGEYAAADNGLSTSEEVIQNKISELGREIEQRQNAIDSCSMNITSLQNAKTAYLQAQSTEKERK